MALFVVATPIGNLEDVTLRALRVLKEVDMVACEDTRRTQVLLNHYKIKKTLISYHQHSRVQKVEYLVDLMKDGKNIALVTDAGTPGVSDPGGVLVQRALEAGIEVTSVPGPSAVAALASMSGIPMDKFLFLGFIPHKKGRQTMLERIIASDVPVVFFESPHRLVKTLEYLKDKKGQLIAGRELTKKFEEVVRGSTERVYKHFRFKKILGEFVIIYSSKLK